MCYFQFQCVKYYLIITAFVSLIIVYYISKQIFTAINMYSADEMSDDEVYFGKLTLKELKKRLFWDKQQTVSEINSPNNSGDHNESFKILQAHSQPNLVPKVENSTHDLSEFIDSEWDMKATDDSFIKMENMVAKLCLSPKRNGKTEELNNTLEVIEYILNNPPSSTKEKHERTDDIKLKTNKLKNEPDLSPEKILREVKKQEPSNSTAHLQNTPVNIANQYHKYAESCNTPRDLKTKPVFKTPSQPPLLKKTGSSLKKTPSRSNAYQHISSPVASYIKNCPIAPLVKDVHPKKPLPGTSSIPKFVKNLPAMPSNKENVILPSVAYKSAKKTRVIDLPDDQKLPQSHWVKKITTTLPRPMVIKHDHREPNFAKKLPQQEDSFADLSYHQAEVSVCTQKSAFKAKKNL